MLLSDGEEIVQIQPTNGMGTSLPVLQDGGMVARERGVTITLAIPFWAMGWICTFAHFMAETLFQVYVEYKLACTSQSYLVEVQVGSTWQVHVKYKLVCESQRYLVEVQFGSTWLAFRLQQFFAPNVLLALQDHRCMVSIANCFSDIFARSALSLSIQWLRFGCSSCTPTGEIQCAPMAYHLQDLVCMAWIATCFAGIPRAFRAIAFLPWLEFGGSCWTHVLVRPHIAANLHSSDNVFGMLYYPV